MKKKTAAQRAAEKVKGRAPKHYKGYELHYKYVEGEELLMGVVPLDDFNEIVTGLTIKELDSAFKKLINQIVRIGDVSEFRKFRRGKRTSIKEFFKTEIIEEKSTALKAKGMFTPEALSKIEENAEWEWGIKWLQPEYYSSGRLPSRGASDQN